MGVYRLFTILNNGRVEKNFNINGWVRHNRGARGVNLKMGG